MKVLIILTSIFSLGLAYEIFDVSSLDIQNLKFEVDKNFVEEFLKTYEEGDVGQITAVVNEYADLVFKNIQNFAVENHLDPLNLTDIENEFLASSITLTNGHLNGIATIDRSDDVTVSYSSSSKILDVHFPIVFSNLNFTYDYHVIILLIGPKGSMVGKIKDFKLNVKLQFDFNTYHAAIEDIRTTNKGHVSITFHGNALVDIVVNILSEFVTTILQPLIGLIVEGVVSDVANLIVNTVNDVIDSILYPSISTVADLI